MQSSFGTTQARRFLASFEDPRKVTWTLAEQISNKLAEEIILGKYRPGQRLQETALAEAFGVSRGPLREALRILEREGLIKIQARRGASVTKLSLEDVRQIFVVRAALYGVAAAELAQHRSSEVLLRLEGKTAALSRALEEEGADEFVALVYQLSMYLAGAAGNMYARNILFSLGRLTLSVTRRVMMAEESRELWTTNWKKIVWAIREEAPDVAREASREWVDKVCDAAMDVLKTESHSFAVTVE